MSLLYTVRLYVEHFENDEVVGLGSQLVRIVNIVSEGSCDCSWYAADVDAYEKLPPQISRGQPSPQLIGSEQEMLLFASSVEQFLSGVFLLMPNNSYESFFQYQFFTEDLPFRDIAPAVVEIRAFDTSYFELYSYQITTLSNIASTFKTVVMSRDTSIHSGAADGSSEGAADQFSDQT